MGGKAGDSGVDSSFQRFQWFFFGGGAEEKKEVQYHNQFTLQNIISVLIINFIGFNVFDGGVEGKRGALILWLGSPRVDRIDVYFNMTN